MLGFYNFYLITLFETQLICQKKKKKTKLERIFQNLNQSTGVVLPQGQDGPWDHPDLKKKIIYNNLKIFICLPFKKILGTPSVFFFFFNANKIKFCSIICSTFKQKEKAQKKKLKLKSKKKLT